jgi:hypothetical protein
MAHLVQATFYVFVVLQLICTTGHSFQCHDLFKVNDQRPAAPMEITAASFPAELKISDGFFNYLKTQISPERMQTLVDILEINSFYANLLPAGLRRSISIDENNLLRPAEEQRIAEFDSESLRHIRAYTVMKDLLHSALENGHVTGLDENMLDLRAQLWATLAADFVPAELGLIYKLRWSTFARNAEVRLTETLKQQRYRNVWVDLIRNNIFLGLDMSDQSVMEMNSLERLSSAARKLEQNRPLSWKDTAELKLLFLRMFMGVGENSFISVDRDFYEVSRPHLQTQMEALLIRHTQNSAFARLDAIYLFDYLIFGIDLPLSPVIFANQFFQKIETHFLVEARNRWRIMETERKAQERETERSQQLERAQRQRNDPDLRLAQQLPSAPKETRPAPPAKVKTRGQAQLRAVETSTPQVAGEQLPRIENLINLREAAVHVLFPDTPYVVQFKRGSNIYRDDQVFIFSERVTEWFMERPSAALKFLSAIHAGMTSLTESQSGIKMLSYVQRADARTFEVKIQSTGERWRMIVEYRDGVWHAVRVVHRDRL